MPQQHWTFMLPLVLWLVGAAAALEPSHPELARQVVTHIAGRNETLLAPTLDAYIAKCVGRADLEWEGFQSAAMQWYLPSDGSGLAIDGGVNLGIKAIAMARRAGYVLGFEPVAWFANLAQGSIALNGLSDRVRVIRAGIGGPREPGQAGERQINMPAQSVIDVDAVVGLVDQDDSSVDKAVWTCGVGQRTADQHIENRLNMGCFSARGLQRSTSDSPVRRLSGSSIASGAMAWPSNVVPEVSLDELQLGSAGGRHLPCPSIIKFDLEGMNTKAIRGSLELLRRCRPTLFTETDAIADDPSARSDHMLQLLHAAGYVSYWAPAQICDHYQGATFQPKTGSEWVVGVDLVAVPAECVLVSSTLTAAERARAVEALFGRADGVSDEDLRSACLNRHEWARRPVSDSARWHAANGFDCWPLSSVPHLSMTRVDAEGGRTQLRDYPGGVRMVMMVPNEHGEAQQCLRQVYMSGQPHVPSP